MTRYGPCHKCGYEFFGLSLRNVLQCCWHDLRCWGPVTAAYNARYLVHVWWTASDR